MTLLKCKHDKKDFAIEFKTKIKKIKLACSNLEKIGEMHGSKLNDTFWLRP